MVCHKGLMLVVGVLLVTYCSSEELECFVKSYEAESADSIQHLVIKELTGTASLTQETAYPSSDTDSVNQCFQECCNLAMTGACDAASFYRTDVGFVCYMLKCGQPFSQCVWGSSPDLSSVAAYMMVVDPKNVTRSQEEIIEDIKWNVKDEEAKQTTGETKETTSPVTTSNPPAPAEEGAGDPWAPQEHVPDVDNTVEGAGDAREPQKQVPDIGKAVDGADDLWNSQEKTPDVGNPQEDAGDLSASQGQVPDVGNPEEGDGDLSASQGQVPDVGNPQEVAGDLSASQSQVPDVGNSQEVAGDPWAPQEHVPDVENDKSLSDSDRQHLSGSMEEDGHVNLPVMFICLAASLGLVILAGIFIFRRISAERDRTIYRPLMDDLRNHGYGESTPLN